MSEFGSRSNSWTSMWAMVISQAACGRGIEERSHNAGADSDRTLGRCVISRNGAAVQQSPLGRVGKGPAPCRSRDGDDVVAPQVTDGLAGPVHGVGQVGIGVDEQQGQQLVAAGHVPVHGRGHHAQVAGYRTHRQPGGAAIHQLTATEFDDARLDLLPRFLAFAHAASLTQPRSLLLLFGEGCGSVTTRESTALESLKEDARWPRATKNRIGRPEPPTR